MICMTGQITEALGAGLFVVKTDDGEVRARPKGKLKMHRIRLFIGDTVEIQLVKGSDVHYITWRN